MAATPASEKRFGSVLEFMRLIWALDHGLQSLSKRMHASFGLTGPQRVTLRVLGRRPGISAGTLAEILRLHPSTLTGILHRLERRELVRRSHDPRDRRRTRLELTPRGRKLDAPSRERSRPSSRASSPGFPRAAFGPPPTSSRPWRRRSSRSRRPRLAKKPAAGPPAAPSIGIIDPGTVRDR